MVIVEVVETLVLVLVVWEVRSVVLAVIGGGCFEVVYFLPHTCVICIVVTCNQGYWL